MVLQVYNNDLMDIATLLRLNSGEMTSGAAASAPVREHILVSCAGLTSCTALNPGCKPN